jgi:hypothetical protein
MFNYLKNKKQTVPNYTIQNLQHYLNVKARKCADYLNRKSIHLSHKVITIGLIIFCFCWSALSIWILLKAVNHRDLPLTINSISLPKKVPTIPAIPQPDQETTQALKRIELFRQYLDSLQLNDFNKYREIQVARPGLLDSIALIEKYYFTIKK